MKCAIMQPTYIPWIGYFHMIAEVDVFVFLDDVQFAKRSWQQRNKIALNGSEKLLTIPALTKGRRQQEINQVLVDNTFMWQKSHTEILKQAYKNHSFYKDLYPIISLLNEEKDYLVDYTTNLIKIIANELGTNTRFINSSDLPISGKRSEYLYNICKFLDAKTYLSAAGSKDYIEQEEIFLNDNINLIYHTSEPYMYNQTKTSKFIPYLSIIDYIANRGLDNFKNDILKK